MNRLKMLCIAGVFACAPAMAHDAMDLDEMLAAFGWDLSKVEITSEKVTDSLHVLFGAGGNIGVSIGNDGVLIVDDQFPELMPKIEKAIRKLGGKGVDFAVNTHWHFDHAEGNLALGPKGTWLVSQINSRDKMLGDHIIDLVTLQYEQKAYPQSALTHITFDDTMQFHLNGERIDLMHAGPAHTTGDTAVIFRGSNAVHLGDVFNNAGYPFIDAGNGGDLTGMINFCKAVLAAIDEDTTVIPGHGPIATYETLQAYIAMLDLMRWRIGAMVADGKTLEEVVAAKPTADFDEKFGDPTNFVNRAYTSLVREAQAQ